MKKGFTLIDPFVFIGIVFILFGLFLILVKEIRNHNPSSCAYWTKVYQSPHAEVFGQPCDFVEPSGANMNAGSDFCLAIDEHIKDSCGKYYFDK